MAEPAEGVQFLDLADGGSLAYRVDGEEGLPWLVLSNSLATDMRLWTPQVEELSGEYRVLRYDQRGHGLSAEPTSSSTTIADLTSDLGELIDHLGITRASVAGISLGGTMAVSIAASRPETFERVMCICSRLQTTEDNRALWLGRADTVLEGGLVTTLDSSLERWVSPVSPYREMSSDMIMSTTPRGYAECARALSGVSLMGSVEALGDLTWYVAGGEDVAAPPAMMKEFSDAAGTELRVVPGARHLANIDAPEAFTALMREWLAS